MFMFAGGLLRWVIGLGGVGCGWWLFCWLFLVVFWFSLLGFIIWRSIWVGIVGCSGGLCRYGGLDCAW